MNNLNYENFDSLKNETFIKFCQELYECFVNYNGKYFEQEFLDNFFEQKNIDYKGKYLILFNDEILFEKGYNKNIINLLNVFFNLYRKNIQVFILNNGSLVEIIPGKKVNDKKISKQIYKMKQEKIKIIIDGKMAPIRLQRI